MIILKPFLIEDTAPNPATIWSLTNEHQLDDSEDKRTTFRKMYAGIVMFSRVIYENRNKTSTKNCGLKGHLLSLWCLRKSPLLHLIVFG